ncbi:hypothetical protein CSPAE12_03453, partial [Colletotrichum incanum]
PTDPLFVTDASGRQSRALGRTVAGPSLCHSASSCIRSVQNTSATMAESGRPYSAVPVAFVPTLPVRERFWKEGPQGFF